MLKMPDQPLQQHCNLPLPQEEPGRLSYRKLNVTAHPEHTQTVISFSLGFLVLLLLITGLMCN